MPKSAVDMAKWESVICTCNGDVTMCETRMKRTRLLQSGMVR